MVLVMVLGQTWPNGKMQTALFPPIRWLTQFISCCYSRSVTFQYPLWLLPFLKSSGHGPKERGGFWLTCRPASLLCRLIIDSPAIEPFPPSPSRNLRLNQVPYWIWSEQPPQCQPAPSSSRVEGMASTPLLPSRRPAQPHSVMLPWLQERVTAWTSPAAITAWMKAVSLVPVEEGPREDQ